MENFLNILITLISALLGAIVGAFITSYLTKKIQKEMIEEQKKHRIEEIKFLRLESLLYNYIKWENQFILDCSRYLYAIAKKQEENFDLETDHPNVVENVNQINTLIELNFPELKEAHERVNFNIRQLIYNSINLPPSKRDYKETNKLFDNFLDASKEFKEEIVNLCP